MKIRKEEAAAIIIDIQDRLWPHMFEHTELDKNVSRLITGLRILNIPVMVTQQYTKGLGPTISSLSQALGVFQPIEKLSFSCCGSPEFCREVERLRKRFLIIAGIESHVCVLQTALDLIGRDYVPVMVEDCISSRKKNDKVMAVERMRSEGMIITTYETILFELLEKAGTETFKKISSLVK